jgi:hypothetical protein
MKYKEKWGLFTGMTATRASFVFNNYFLDVIFGRIELYIWKLANGIKTPIIWPWKCSDTFEFGWTGLRYGFIKTANICRNIHLSHYYNATHIFSKILEEIANSNTLVLYGDNDLRENYLFKKYFKSVYAFKTLCFSSDYTKFFDKGKFREKKVLTFGSVHLISELYKRGKLFYLDSYDRLAVDFPNDTFHSDRLFLSQINHPLLVKYFTFWGIDSPGVSDFHKINLNELLNRYKYFIVGGEDSGAIPIGLLDGIAAGCIPIVSQKLSVLISTLCKEYLIYRDINNLIEILNEMDV